MSLFISKKLKQSFIAPILAIMLILPQGMALAQNPPSTAPVTMDVGIVINAAENTAGFTITQSLTGTEAVVGDNIVLKLMGYNAFWQEHQLTEEDITQDSYNFSIPSDALRVADITDGPREIRAFVNFPQEGGGTQDTATSSPLNLTLDTTPPELKSAKLTGPNAITLEYSELVNTTSTDYTSLVLTNVLEERTVTEVLGSGTKTIMLTFDGAPVASSETAVVDIASTVQDLAGNPLAAITRQVVNDGQAPNAPVIVMVAPPDIGLNIASGTAEVGSTVELFEGETSLGKIVTDGSENWFISFGFTTDGKHILAAKATDAAGNTSTLSDPFEALVPDATPPVITLLGENPMNVESGSQFTDPGATAMDNFDRDITEQIQVTGAVNTAVLGTYELTYAVADTTGNTANMVRTVKVVDTTAPNAPTLQIDTENNYKLSGTAEAGSTVEIFEGAISYGTTVAAGDGNWFLEGATPSQGPHTIFATAKDTSGNTSGNSDTVNFSVPDTIAPVITLKGDNPVNVEFGNTYEDAGASALDNVDGDIAGSIQVDAENINMRALGTYQVGFSVSDAAGNTATATRTVNVVDTTAPTITLTGGNPLTLEYGTSYQEPGYEAMDAVDGNLTESVAISGSVPEKTLGEFVISYSVTDAAGNGRQVSRTVKVVDTTKPVITLKGSATVKLAIGAEYTDAGASALDNVDGDMTASIVVTGATVDTSVAGTYTVTYNVKDTAGNAATEVTRTVFVDNAKPVITLTGDATVKVKKGAVYTDAGATALDDVDGNMTESIVTGNPVDTGTVGTYTVTYNVKDSVGNAATQVTRTVIVDGGSPVITLKGSATITLQPAAFYVDAGATASDDIDGDITAKIVTTNPVNTQFASTYIVNYTVTDSAGNETQMTRTVIVLPGGGSNGPSGSSGTPTPSVAAPQPQVLGASTARFHNGEILKLKGSYRYYIFKDGKRVRLPNWKFREMFHGKYTQELDAQTLFGIPYDRTAVDGIL